MFNRLFITLIAIVLAGCASLADQWTTEVVEDKNAGPKPANYEATIKDYLGKTLKDPFSMKIQNVTKPVEGIKKTSKIIQSPTLMNVHGRILETQEHGWHVTAEVNGKNSYGGYTGWHSYTFIFRGEELIFVEDVTAKNEKAKRFLDSYVGR